MPQTKSGAQNNDWISFMKKAQEAYREFKEAQKVEIQQKQSKPAKPNRVNKHSKATGKMLVKSMTAVQT